MNTLSPTPGAFYAARMSETSIEVRAVGRPLTHPILTARNAQSREELISNAAIAVMGKRFYEIIQGMAKQGNLQAIEAMESLEVIVDGLNDAFGVHDEADELESGYAEATRQWKSDRASEAATVREVVLV